MMRTISWECLTMTFSANICCFHSNYSAWISTNSLSRTIFREFLLAWYVDLPFKFSKHWNFSETKTLSIAIWNQKTFCLSNQTSLASRLSTMGAAVFRICAFIPTFSRDFIGRPKLFLAYRTLQQSTCGLSGASWPNCIQDIRCFQVKMKQNS